MSYRQLSPFHFSEQQDSFNENQLEEYGHLYNPNIVVPIKSDKSDDSQDHEKDSKENKQKGKKKTITKECKCQTKSKKYQKRKKDENVNAQFGRPSNKIFEADHLKENKSYNDIVYHFSRFLIFLKYKQGNEKFTHALELTDDQNKWISKVEAVMETDNFPRFQDPKPHFLLHPNSPHFVFDHLKKTQNKVKYSSEEVHFIMIAYLKRKGLLTSSIFHYINDYWKDIMFLVNNPKGEIGENIPDDDSSISGQAVEMQNENMEVDNRKEGKKKAKNNEEEKTIPIPENKLLAKELEIDPTIAAYEIACYLHACCEKYLIKID